MFTSLVHTLRRLLVPTKLDRYIVRKFLGTFFFILLIIIVVSVVIDVAEKIDDFIERKPPMSGLIKDYYLNFIIYFGNLLSPICVFLAVIFFTSRLTQNTEIVAMLTGGVSFYRVMRTYLFTSFVLAAASFYLNAYLVPEATKVRIDFEYKYLKNARVSKDVNIHKKVAEDTQAGTESFVYLYSFNQILNQGYIFSMELIKDGDILRKLNGDKIIWNDSTKKWRVHGVRVREFLPDGTERLTRKETIDTTFNIGPQDLFQKEMKAQSMPLDELQVAITNEQLRGSGLAEGYVVEKYRRYAYPFASIILTLIGFAVSTKKRRGGTPLSLGIGLVISFQYVLLVVVGQAIFGEDVPKWIGVWFPNFLYFLVAMLLLRIAPK